MNRLVDQEISGHIMGPCACLGKKIYKKSGNNKCWSSRLPVHQQVDFKIFKYQVISRLGCYLHYLGFQPATYNNVTQRGLGWEGSLTWSDRQVISDLAESVNVRVFGVNCYDNTQTSHTETCHCFYKHRKCCEILFLIAIGKYEIRRLIRLHPDDTISKRPSDRKCVKQHIIRNYNLSFQCQISLYFKSSFQFDIFQLL